MKNSTHILTTTIYCGMATAASAMLLNGAPAESPDSGISPLGRVLAEMGEALQLGNAAIAETDAVGLEPSTNAAGFADGVNSEPAILAYMGISLVGFSMAGRQRKLRLLDVGAALSLLVYFAPLLALAAAAVRLSGPGAIVQQCEVLIAGGRRIRLRRFRTTPPADAGRWQRLLLSALLATRIAGLPVLMDVMSGDIDLRTAVQSI